MEHVSEPSSPRPRSSLSDDEPGPGSTNEARKVRRKCPDHPSEYKEIFCVECKLYVCDKCKAGKHDGHKSISAEDHERDLEERVHSVITNADALKNRLSLFGQTVKEQTQQASMSIQASICQVDAQFNEMIDKLRERRNNLVRQYERHENILCGKLDEVVGRNDLQISQIAEMDKLVRGPREFKLEGNDLLAFHGKCQEFLSVLKRSDVDDSILTATRRELTEITFKPRMYREESLLIGSIGEADPWVLTVEVPLCHNGCISTMATTANGSMVVGLRTGGIRFFSHTGKLLKSALKDLRIQDLAFTYEGEIIVVSLENKISVYAADFEKLQKRKFKTLSAEKGGACNVAVDQVHHIYVSYFKAKQIQVFLQEGGRAAKVIPCVTFSPLQMFALNVDSLLVVKASANSVTIVNNFGNLEKTVGKDGDFLAYPAVCLDSSILIAWVRYKEGLVSIDMYNRHLEFLKSIISDHIFRVPQKQWYYLQQFLTGELAFCTPEKMYIFGNNLDFIEVNDDEYDSSL